MPSRRTSAHSPPSSPDDDPLRLRVLHQLASIAHRRGDLPCALEQYDAGARAALQLHREWAPWGQECRLLGGLTAYELGDWEGATRRLDLAGAPAPQPGRTIFTGALLSIRAGRGETVDPAILAELREWWPVDGLCVVLTVMPGVDLLGQTGDLAGALDLAEAAERSLDRVWGDYYAIVRLAALVAGQVASAFPQLDPPLRRRALDVARRLGARAVAFAQTTPEIELAGRPAFERSARDELEETGREAWAWLARLEAELARLELGGRHGSRPHGRRPRRGLAQQCRRVRPLRPRLRGGSLAGPARRSPARVGRRGRLA